MTNKHAPRLVVTVGTDHHPFKRLMAWVDGLVASRLIEGHAVTAQVGTTAGPQHAVTHRSLPRDQLLSLMSTADVVVCHGGPGTIMDARRMGTRPVVVPRRADLGEHVDDHQIRFARHLAQEGLVELAEDESQFATAVGRGLTNPAVLALRDADDRAAASARATARIAKIAEAPEDTVSGWRRLIQLLRAMR